MIWFIRYMMPVSKDSPFSIEVDLVKMTDVQYHLLIEGFLGELEGVELTDGCLTMKELAS